MVVFPHLVQLNLILVRPVPNHALQTLTPNKYNNHALRSRYIGAYLESRFPSLHTSDAAGLYMYRRSRFMAYPYLNQRGHNVWEQKCGHLKAILYVGKKHAVAYMDVGKRRHQLSYVVLHRLHQCGCLCWLQAASENGCTCPR